MATNPRSAYLSFVGVAKDTVNGNLSASYAAAVTSIVLTNVVGTPTASMSAIIIDGPLTEIVAVSGWNSGTSTATVAATANAHSANVYVAFQLTASIGPTALIRVTKIDFSDAYDNKLYDKSYIGSQVSIHGAQQGMRLGNFSLEGDLFADEFGYIAASFFGAYDYTATSGSSPTTYAFSPANTGQGQPNPYLWFDYNPGDGTMRVFAKAVISDLTIKFDPGALVGWTATGMSFASGIVFTGSTSPTATSFLSGLGFTSFTPVPAWEGGAVIGGTITPDLLTAEYSFKREEFGPVNTLQGVQDPLAIFSGPVSLAVTTSIIQPGDDVQLNNYINQSQPTFKVSAIKGLTTAQNGISITTTKANYEDVKTVQTGKAYVTLDVPFEALANTTDATTAGTGWSPAKLTLSVGTNTGSSSTPY